MTGLAGRKVMIVEDEYFIADDLAAALKSAGAEVIGPASSDDEALALLDASTPDFAVLDINLRGDVSFRVADELSARKLPFVFATGYDARTIPERHALAPVWQKPFDIDALVAALAGRADLPSPANRTQADPG